jgi:hypothetical protein
MKLIILLFALAIFYFIGAYVGYQVGKEKGIKQSAEWLVKNGLVKVTNVAKDDEEVDA